MRTATVIGCAMALGVALGLGRAAAEEPKLPAPPASVEEACDPAILTRCQLAPAAQATMLGLDVDQRTQRVLAEERRLDQAPPPGRVAAFRWTLIGLTSLGLVLAIVGLLRRRPLVGLLGVALLASLLGLSPQLRRALGADEPDHAAILRLARCRLLLAEARATLRQTQIATCLHDLSEVDEDLLGWEEKLRSGPGLTVEEIRHLRDEIKPR